jgi:hypothetical protein
MVMSGAAACHRINKLIAKQSTTKLMTNMAGDANKSPSVAVIRSAIQRSGGDNERYDHEHPIRVGKTAQSNTGRGDAEYYPSARYQKRDHTFQQRIKHERGQRGQQDDQRMPRTDR